MMIICAEVSVRLLRFYSYFLIHFFCSALWYGISFVLWHPISVPKVYERKK